MIADRSVQIADCRLVARPGASSVLHVHRVTAGVVAVVSLILFGVSPLPSQEPERSDLTVSLITVAPGAKSWEMFGHNAIRVRDPRSGTDLSYNYGLFSFEQENFILRFLQGRMLYWMAGIESDYMIAAYREANRSIWEQELALSAVQAEQLQAFLEWNARPENAHYRYDYYYDNCSTRVRDAIDSVIGGALREATETVETGTTFRSHTQRLTTGNPLLYTGLLLGLGQPVDRPITAWEEMFLPVEVMKRVRELTVHQASGEVAPLVRAERILFQSTRPPERAQPPAWLVAYLLVGTGLGAVFLWLGKGIDANGVRRVAFALVTGAWTLLVGVAGFVLLGLWTLTDHSAAYQNENLFTANPIGLPLAALLLMGILWRRPIGGATRWLAVALAVFSLIGLVIQVLPSFDQVNGQLLALAVPAHIGLAWAIGRKL